MWYLSSPTKDQINIPCNRITGVFELYFNQCSRQPTLKVIVDPSWINIYHIYYCLYLLSLFLIPIFCPLLPATREGNGTPLQYFAWKIPWTEEPGRLQSMGSLESDTTERLHFDFSLSCIGEGNGNPLQCSCLENPMDGEAWWAAVYGVAESDTTEAT